MSTLHHRLAAARSRLPRRLEPDRALPLLVRMLAAILEWRRRMRSRVALAHLSDRELRDIGLTCADADRECRKPFWVE